LSAELTKTHSFRLFFWPPSPPSSVSKSPKHNSQTLK